jgi:hypothetical protein
LQHPIQDAKQLRDVLAVVAALAEQAHLSGSGRAPGRA